MPDGQLTLDGQILELARGPNGQGWAWEHHSIAAVPGVASAEDRQYNRAPESNFRTTAWTDWSGGIGAAKHMPGEHRLHYSESPTAEMPGRIVRGHAIRTVAPNAAGTVAVSDFFEINNGSTQQLYVIIGQTVRLITLTRNAELVANRIGTSGVGSGGNNGVWVSSSNFTQASPLWNDTSNTDSTKVFIGTDTYAEKMVSFNGNATWALATDADTAVSYWALGNYGDGVRLWGSTSDAATNGMYIRNLAGGNNPFTAASWAPAAANAYKLSQRQDKITALAVLRDNLIVAAQDGGVYALPYLTGGIIFPLTDIKGMIRDTNSGLNMRVWGGVLFVPLARGLFAYIEEGAATGRFEAVGPEHLYGHEMPIRGICSAMFAGDPAGLWAAFYDVGANNSYVLRGRWSRSGDPTQARFIWDTMGVGLISGLKVTALHISHIGDLGLTAANRNPVLCIGTDVPDVRFVTLPRAMRNMLDDANCRSQTTSRSAYLPDVDGGAPTTLKRFWRVRFKTVGFTADEYANVFVRADRGTYRQVGIIDRVPVDDVPLPKGTEGVSLGVRMDWVGTVNTVFPQIEGVETDYTETPLPAEWIDVVVYAARGQHQRTGISLLSQSDILHLVRGLQGQVREVDCVGPEEETYVVKVDSATDVVATPVEEIPGRGPGWHIRFRLNVYNALLDQADMIWDSSQWSSLSTQSHWQ